jgi:xanthine/uracil/vitamin C permease (AzgA family)
MTLMKAGSAVFLAGMALIVFGSRTEVQAINAALTRRLKTGIGLALGGIAVMLLGLRLQGEIVAHKVKRRFRPQIDAVKRRLEPLLQLFKSAAGKTRR